jgi:5'-methylthioinosine phosphorylase
VTIDLAVIGGTGLYNFPDLRNAEKRAIDTPFGAPSGPIVVGSIANRTIAFLARHGEDHLLAPHRVNYRASIVGVYAVGGFRHDMRPCVVSVPDQIIDYTSGRLSSFSDVEGSKVVHIDFSEPYSGALRKAILAAASRASIDVVGDGCYGATQGPRLETRAEIARLRRDGCDLVGMTGMPEAALARELSIEYACLALVANWAAGCGDEDEISLEEIFRNLDTATAKVPPIIAALLTQP